MWESGSVSACVFLHTVFLLPTRSVKWTRIYFHFDIIHWQRCVAFIKKNFGTPFMNLGGGAMKYISLWFFCGQQIMSLGICWLPVFSLSVQSPSVWGQCRIVSPHSWVNEDLCPSHNACSFCAVMQCHHIQVWQARLQVFFLCDPHMHVSRWIPSPLSDMWYVCGLCSSCSAGGEWWLMGCCRSLLSQWHRARPFTLASQKWSMV